MIHTGTEIFGCSNDSTSACSLNYEAEYNRIKPKYDEMNLEIGVLREQLEKYKLVVRALEAFCGKTIIE